MLERIHDSWVHPRRIRVLAQHLARLLPPGPLDVLDVGCGDGQVAAALLALRPELRARGFEIQPRDGTAIPVETFDGRELPLAAKSVDYVLFIDVLHHTEAPQQLLREGIRVARRGILVKDHLLQGFLARATLRLMDGVGNARHGVALPYNYWAPAKWREVFEKTDLHGAWNTELRLYPIPLDWLFGRSLHFLVRLESNITPRLGAFRPEPVAVE